MDEGCQIRSHIKWKTKRDMVSTEFFRAIRKRISSTIIICLKNTQGVKVRDCQGLENLCTDFYKSLYQATPLSPKHTAISQMILNIVMPRVQLDIYKHLPKPLSLSELADVAKNLVHGKSPSPDGHAIELYIRLWPIIGTNFHEMILKSIRNGALPYNMNTDMIILLHKGGSTNEISKLHSSMWRTRF